MVSGSGPRSRRIAGFGGAARLAPLADRLAHKRGADVEKVAWHNLPIA